MPGGQSFARAPQVHHVEETTIKRWRENSPFKTELEILMSFQHSFSVYPAQCGKIST